MKKETKLQVKPFRLTDDLTIEDFDWSGSSVDSATSSKLPIIGAYILGNATDDQFIARPNKFGQFASPVRIPRLVIIDPAALAEGEFDSIKNEIKVLLEDNGITCVVADIFTAMMPSDEAIIENELFDTPFQKGLLDNDGGLIHEYNDFILRTIDIEQWPIYDADKWSGGEILLIYGYSAEAKVYLDLSDILNITPRTTDPSGTIIGDRSQQSLQYGLYHISTRYSTDVGADIHGAHVNYITEVEYVLSERTAQINGFKEAIEQIIRPDIYEKIGLRMFYNMIRVDIDFETQFEDIMGVPFDSVDASSEFIGGRYVTDKNGIYNTRFAEIQDAALTLERSALETIIATNGGEISSQEFTSRDDANAFNSGRIATIVDWIKTFYELS